MSKIDLSKVLDSDSKAKPKLDSHLKQSLIIASILIVVFGAAIIFISLQIVDLPFKEGSRNLSVTVADSVNVSEEKIAQVKESYLQILPNSFWEHKNFTDIDYSSRTIGRAVNNALGYKAKEQSWSYTALPKQRNEIVSVNGEITLNNIRYEAIISFSISGTNIFFYDLKLKEKQSRAEFQIASARQNIYLIQKMYRD